MWLRHTLYRSVAKIKKIFTENGRYLLFDNLLKAGKFTVGQGCPLLVNVVRKALSFITDHFCSLRLIDIFLQLITIV